MTASTMISPQAFWNLVGTPDCPVVVDARTDEDFAADPRVVPAAIRRPGLEAADWADAFANRDAVVYCERGLKISQGAAAWLRHVGARAAALEGGFQGWREAGLPLVPDQKIPPRDQRGRTHWVSRERPSVEGIARAWLIRRFVDPAAVFLFVEAPEVDAVAERFQATPFGEEAGSFAALVEGFDLATSHLKRLTALVRSGAGSEPAPEAPGLRAAIDGLSRMHADDMALLEAGTGLFDALFRWARDGSGEAYTNQPQAGGAA